MPLRRGCGTYETEAIAPLPGGADLEHDFARHVGVVFPRGAYKLTRDRVEEMHPGTSFRDFFQGTVSVTDYNMLGAVMYHLHRDNMKWMEVTGEDRVTGAAPRVMLRAHDRGGGANGMHSAR